MELQAASFRAGHSRGGLELGERGQVEETGCPLLMTSGNQHGVNRLLLLFIFFFVTELEKKLGSSEQTAPNTAYNETLNFSCSNSMK